MTGLSRDAAGDPGREPKEAEVEKEDGEEGVSEADGGGGMEEGSKSFRGAAAAAAAAVGVVEIGGGSGALLSVDGGTSSAEC